jgi:hypothetical protein
MNAQQAQDRAIAYGAHITGEAVGPEYHATVEKGVAYTFHDIQALGGRITRLRLLSDPGFPMWDVSYCHATLPDGRIVRVETTFFQLPRRNTIGAIIEDARREGYHAKAIGLLDRGNWSTLS